MFPAYDHVVVVVMENHDYGDIIGNPGAPYINSLASGGAVLSNYDAVSHPSEPNYFALYAGSTFGVEDDGTHPELGPSLYTELAAAGKSFTGFVEAGSPPKHNPWESFPEGASVEKDFSQFPADYSQLPSVAYVVPNLQDDMHDGTIAQGDQWLQQNLSGYAQWAQTHNSLLIVTWDESATDPGGQNQVPAILYGARVSPGLYGTAYNHYNMLATIAVAEGAPAPNNAAGAAPIDVFAALPSGSSPPAQSSAPGQASPSNPASPPITGTDETTGMAVTSPVNTLDLSGDNDSLTLASTQPGAMISLGEGDNTVALTGGGNVVSTGGALSQIINGTGSNIAFLNTQNQPLAWDAVANFHAGDAVAVIGAGPASVSWQDVSPGNGNFSGLTMMDFTAGRTAFISLPGATLADMEAGRIVSTFGTTANGLPYALIVHA